MKPDPAFGTLLIQHKRNVKEKALSEIKEQLDMEISLVGPRFFLSSSKMRAITKQAAASHSDILL